MSSQLIFSVKEALVRYKETPVFEDLTLNIHQGSRIALVGKNGAGKSTIMNIITGVKSLDEGERWENPGTIIGYLVQDFQPNEKETVFDFIFNNIKGEDRELYQYKVDIAAEALDLDVKKPMTMLSGGQLRRAGLAKAFVEEPDILLLDEPTSGLDPNQLIEVRELIKKIGKEKTLMLSTHIMQEAEAICDRVVILSKGEIVADTPTNRLYEKSDLKCVFVEFQGPVTKSQLSKIKSITRVEARSGGWLLYSETEDLRPHVSKFSQDNNLVILTLQLEQKSLSSVFKDLTQ